MKKLYWARPFFLIILYLALLFMIAPAASGQGLRVDNTFRPAGKSYYWTVFLVAPSSTLDAIRYVEYTPQSSKPVRITNRKSSFSLSQNGSQEIVIKVKVVYKDSRVTTLQYRLRLKGKAKSSVIRLPTWKVAGKDTEDTLRKVVDDAHS
ncbi:MAG TPA: pYEATS domain-containing protein [Pyrinomonadaceae bacterium]|nr:pYEATS domain-containing protein [Pyrinomonadaceae bacterium]